MAITVNTILIIFLTTSIILSISLPSNFSVALKTKSSDSHTSDSSSSGDNGGSNNNNEMIQSAVIDICSDALQLGSDYPHDTRVVDLVSSCDSVISTIKNNCDSNANTSSRSNSLSSLSDVCSNMVKIGQYMNARQINLNNYLPQQPQQLPGATTNMTNSTTEATNSTSNNSTGVLGLGGL
jgi:hypothetical protein